jgi:erythromycin esterase-like protein
VLRWLRDFNADRADKVQFVGVEYYLTPDAAYDRVETYVAATAPEVLPRLREHLQVIRPTTPNVFAHIQSYMGIADKEPYIQHARQIAELVSNVPHEPDDPAFALALHTAQQIVSFYEHFSLPDAEGLVYRDAHAAENLRWWRDYSGDRIAYWAAAAHTANAPQLRIAVPPAPDLQYPAAGSYLRQWFGQAYVSIGFTFDHGVVSVGEGATAEMAAPAEDWLEHPLGQVAQAQFAVDLRRPAPANVRSWLVGPIVTRGLSDRGPESFMDGGTPIEWFDLIVHRQELTPAQPLQHTSAASTRRRRSARSGLSLAA